MKSWPLPSEEEELKQSTARSGSMFYTTQDKKYLFKTILHPEVQVMMDLLKDYYKHVQEYPRTFIVKIYGLFRCSIGANKTWILIMGNSFPPGVSLSQKYDLKGRKAKPGKSIEERAPVSHSIFKDNEIDRTIILDPDDKKFYLFQLEMDVALLEKHQIMDYSLLVGIHAVTEDEKQRSKAIKLNKKSKINIKIEKDEIEKVEKKRSHKSKPEDQLISSKSNDSKNDKKTKNKIINDIEKEKSNMQSSSTSKRNSEDNPTKSKKSSRRTSRDGKKITSRKNSEDGKTKKDTIEDGRRPTKIINDEEKLKKGSREARPALSRRSSEEDAKRTTTKNSDDEKPKKSSRRTSKDGKKVLSRKSSEGKNLEEAKGSSRKSAEFDKVDSSRRKKENKDRKHKSEEAIEEIDIYSYGGLRGTNPKTGEEEIIFFGIIDNLTSYNINKKMANFFKNAIWDDETLSTVPASFYARRFNNFMMKNLLGDEPLHFSDSEESDPPFPAFPPPPPSPAPAPAKKLNLNLEKIEKSDKTKPTSPRATTERPSHPKENESIRVKQPGSSRQRVKSDLYLPEKVPPKTKKEQRYSVRTEGAYTDEVRKVQSQESMNLKPKSKKTDDRRSLLVELKPVHNGED
uniref:PIPK domain-containing protein n=1 Tax=Arcella intermedia TaxID=1963864 RepID=A0A6B2KZG4_9EUKA